MGINRVRCRWSRFHSRSSRTTKVGAAIAACRQKNLATLTRLYPEDHPRERLRSDGCCSVSSKMWRSARFDTAVNLKPAKALGVTIPTSILLLRCRLGNRAGMLLLHEDLRFAVPGHVVDIEGRFVIEIDEGADDAVVIDPEAGAECFMSLGQLCQPALQTRDVEAECALPACWSNAPCRGRSRPAAGAPVAMEAARSTKWALLANGRSAERVTPWWPVSAWKSRRSGYRLL